MRGVSLGGDLVSWWGLAVGTSRGRDRLWRWVLELMQGGGGVSIFTGLIDNSLGVKFNMQGQKRGGE